MALQRVDAGQDPKAAKITLAEFVVDRWLPHLEAQGKPRPRTVHRYAELLRLHVLPMIGGVRVDRLTPGAVQVALDAMSKKGLAPRAVGQARAALSSALTSAVRWQVVLYNPVRATTAPTARPPKLVVPTAPQLRQLIDVAAAGPWAVPVLLAATTGARRGEVLGLTWDNVDFAFDANPTSFR